MNKVTLGFIALSLIASTSFAADTARLNLSGTVPSLVSLDIDGVQDKNVTVDVLNGQAKAVIATATQSSNHVGGYSIYATPTYGKLVHASVASAQYDYDLSYGGVAILNNTDKQQVFTSGVLSSLSSVDKDIELGFTAKPDAPSGEYSETITFTIETNS